MIITIITTITINIIVSSGAEYITVASSLQGPVRPTAFPTQAAQQSPSETCSDAARCCLHFFRCPGLLQCSHHRIWPRQIDTEECPEVLPATVIPVMEALQRFQRFVWNVASCHYSHYNRPQSFKLNTLWLFNIAMENGPFIVDFPIKNGDFQ